MAILGAIMSQLLLYMIQRRQSWQSSAYQSTKSTIFTYFRSFSKIWSPTSNMNPCELQTNIWHGIVNCNAFIMCIMILDRFVVILEILGKICIFSRKWKNGNQDFEAMMSGHIGIFPRYSINIHMISLFPSKHLQWLLYIDYDLWISCCFCHRLGKREYLNLTRWKWGCNAFHWKENSTL